MYHALLALLILMLILVPNELKVLSIEEYGELASKFIY